MEKLLYAAYGSNMNMKQMSQRCHRAVDRGIGIIKNYEMYFSYKGVANIQPDKGNHVPVVVWELTKDCEIALDYYEGYPHLYIKKIVPVTWNGIDQDMMVYILKEPYNRVTAKPSKSYFNCIKEGYFTHCLDLDKLDDAQNCNGKERTIMTIVQKMIIDNINKNFVEGSVQIELKGTEEVSITDRNIEHMTLTVNMYSDIIDAETYSRWFR